MESFLIDVPQPVLDDLRRRLSDTRWPDAVADDWDRGTQPSALRRLVGYWRDEFDWRAVERRLNALDQYRVDVDGVGLHVVRTGRSGAPPLLLLHGWPDSFLRFLRLLPLLGDRFDLVVPSIPGFGFSDRPTAPGMDPNRIAGLFADLMTRLGFDRFGVHAGDVGGAVAELIAARFPDRVSGLHLTDEAVHLDRTGLPDRVDVPTAVAIFPQDTVPAPREFAQRWFDLRRWTEMPRGGHFAAWEEPDLLADDLVAFFGSPDVRG